MRGQGQSAPTIAVNDRLFVEAFFGEFREKVNRLGILSQDFPEEALILCCVYIDNLATGRYFDGRTNAKERFCRALIELSDEPFFAAIHPRVLRDEARKYDSKHQTRFSPLVSSLVEQRPSEFLDSDWLKLEVGATSLKNKTEFVANLWRSSVAAICYDRIRCQSVHGPGRNIPLSFSSTKCNGKTAPSLGFELLHSALRSIFDEVEGRSLQTGSWFGKLLYSAH